MLHLPPFRNVAFYDFTEEATSRRMRDAIEHVRGQLGLEVPAVVAGERLRTGNAIRSHSPSHPGRVVALGRAAGEAEVERAVAAAWEAFGRWRRVAPEERAHLFLRAARMADARRMEFIAWSAFEVGKNWNEANGEIGEVVDHFELYARELLRYASGQPIPSLPGEISEYVYEPLGAGAVLSPWNFPFALPSGIILGAIAAGNTVVWKPAGNAVACAYQFLRLLEDAGFPPGVVNLVPGSGAVVGEALVRHPQVRFISFVGSKDVGIQVYREGAVVRPGQRWLKRMVTEMGGKNATIVAADADLDLATDVVARGAYGYQGQKCSACSRAIVDRSRYDAFLERLVERARSLVAGPAEENAPLGPLIDEAAVAKVSGYVEAGREEGRLLTGGRRLDGEGWYFAPTVLADVDPGARVAQEEIFGPVLSVIPCDDFDQALRIANGTEYALTGAVVTRDPDLAARAATEFRCGNLNLNRPCTGAMAGVHPFGGFDMSGTGPKVGGPDYLSAYLQAKVIARKLV